MAESEHDRGDRKQKFCTVPAQPKCGDVSGCADYVKICDPKWDSKKVSHAFKRIVNAKAGAYVFEKKYEAHHILCVAPITEELLGNDDIQGAIAQTEWCINNKDNMMGMPLWGHTVKHYCQVSKDGESAAGRLAMTAPPWKNIPQHDIDHNSKEGYTWEVEKEAAKLAVKVDEAGHKLQGKTLKDGLIRLQGYFRGELNTRGSTRLGGTHKAWKAAQEPECNPLWFTPFSMASEGKWTRLGFPVRSFDSRVAAWVERIKNGIIGIVK